MLSSAGPGCPRRGIVVKEIDLAAYSLRQCGDAVLQIDHVVAEVLPGGDMCIRHFLAIKTVFLHGITCYGSGMHEVF